jgi:hypothetical protein
LVAEQTTPAASAVIDADLSVSGIQAPDDDLDADELGGYVTWVAPGAGAVSEYVAYLASDAGGSSRMGPLGGTAVAYGTNAALLPMNTPNVSFTHVLVYTKSSLAEQTTPAENVMTDSYVRIGALVFPDKDLDAGDLGGTVSWTPIATPRLDRFAVYLSEDSVGTDPYPAKGLMGSDQHVVPVGTNELNVPSDTAMIPPPNGIYTRVARTHVVLFAASVLAEQTTPAAVTSLTDVAVSVSAVQFEDLDLDVGELGGNLSWTPPASVADVIAYNVFLTGLVPPRNLVDAVIVGNNSADNSKYGNCALHLRLRLHRVPIGRADHARWHGVCRLWRECLWGVFQ